MKLQVFIDQKRRQFVKKKKLMKRKVFFLKARIFLTCVLPVVILLLAAKVIQTLVRMELRKAAANVAGKGGGNEKSKKAVVQTRETRE